MTRVEKAELRRLAEAAAHKDWYAGNAYDKPFTINSQIITDTPDGKYVLLDGNHHFRADCVANVAFVGAASPAVVLSLLDSEAQAKCEAGHAIQQKDAAYEKCNHLRSELDAALAELEACRKDAERYRWLRGRLPGSAYRIAGVIYSEGGQGVDVAIDAAMAQEATNA